MKKTANQLLTRVILAPMFPLVLQSMMLLAFLAILYGGYGISTEDAAFAKILRNTNLSNLLIWSYWWPLIIVGAVLLGRVWCTVCPMELVSYLASRVGLRCPVPVVMKSGWIMTVFYIAIVLIGVHTLAIHRQPHRMAIYMLVLLVTALICGLVFQKRAFCSYVCPIGHLLGLYSVLSWFKWGTVDARVCGDCHTKDCIRKDNHYRLTGRACTSNLNPAAINDDRECLLCTQCAKVCPNQNLTLFWRRPWEGVIRQAALKHAHILFVMIVCGFVVYEILSEWSESKVILTWIPNAIVQTCHISAPFNGLVSALVMFVGYPTILYSGVGLLSRILSPTSPNGVFKALSLLLIPTMAAAHLLKACLKMASRIPYWKYVFTDPLGVETARQISDKTLVLDKTIPNAIQPGLSVLMIVALLVALFLSGMIVRRSQTFKELEKGAKSSVIIGALLYWAVFVVTIILWRW